MQAGETHHCGGTVTGTEFRYVVLEHAVTVPGLQCDQCHEEYLTAEVDKRLEALMHDEITLADSGFDHVRIPSTAAEGFVTPSTAAAPLPAVTSAT